MPTNPENRAEWVSAIEKSQRITIQTTVFNVCERHFENSDMIMRGSEKMLLQNCIPTIFQSNVDSTAEVSKTSETEELKKKISELEANIARLTIEKDVAVQHERIKAAEAVKAQKIKLNEAKAEISNKNDQITKISQVVQDLRNHHLISEKNAKFLNVS